jgi:hypothetical protein
MDVKVTNSAGKVMYRGKTDSQGMFATTSLAPGSYVVQFNAATTAKGGPLALMVHAGNQESSAESVPASKFNKGGVAIKIQLSSATTLSGQVAPAGTKMAGATANATTGATTKAAANTGKKSKLKTKVMSGKTYVWIAGDDSMGSSFGGHWVPEDSAEGRKAEANAR